MVKKTLGAAIFVILVCLCVLWSFKHHLLWTVYFEPRSPLEYGYEAPISEMPRVSVPDEWVAVEIGNLRLSLPENTAKNKSLTTDSPPYTIFQDDRFSVVVSPRNKTSPATDASLLEAASIHPDEPSFTWTSLRAELYRADESDFSWFMTNEQLFWYEYCMVHRLELPGQKVETRLFENGADKLLILEKEQSQIQFQSRNCPMLVTVLVKSTGPEPLDYDVVRAICESIAYPCP